jgi:hypothetical protein
MALDYTTFLLADFRVLLFFVWNNAQRNLCHTNVIARAQPEANQKKHNGFRFVPRSRNDGKTEFLEVPLISRS